MARCYIRGRLQACHCPARFASCGENQQVDLYTGWPVFGKPALQTDHPATSEPGGSHCIMLGAWNRLTALTHQTRSPNGA